MLRRRLARLQVLGRMAWHNLFNHKAKNAAVGLLMAFGTFLVVVGSSTLESIESAMTRSVTGSIAGHLQVYDDDARDALALFGGGFLGVPDIGRIPDFSRVKDALLAVDDVAAVIPMGIDFAEFYSPTELDVAIESLRKALEAGDEQRIGRMEQKVRAMAALMADELANRRKIAKDKTEIDTKRADVATVMGDAFWRELRRDPAAGTTFLDTRLAPLVDENEGYGLNYIGTDIDAFVTHFDRFELVSGELVPPGAHGLLVNQHFYDELIRNKVARMFDELERERATGKRIARDPLLQNKVKQMVRQYRRVTFTLEPEDAESLERRLSDFLGEQGKNLDQLVQAFLAVDDASFDRRYAFFQEAIVPHIELYRFEVGDVITIRAFTRSGYPRSVNLKVYGTFTFRGLEESALAGIYSLMDLVTFRDLYGVMSDDQRAELAAIKASVGLADVPADEAEAMLFGDDASSPAADPGEAAAAADDPLAALAARPAGPDAPDLPAAQRFDQRAIDHGLALNAAVLLHDPSRLEEARARIESVIAERGLGFTVVDWRAATGFVGQFVSLAGMVLYIAITIIFIVAVVIMNNTMVMATVERATEIGTMRAIGSRRGFVLALFLLETLILGALAGLLGGLAGFGVMSWLGQAGIPAPSDELIFLFSGPRLFPAVGLEHVVTAFGLILVVSLVATFYPALIATRIQPVVAMQPRE